MTGIIRIIFLMQRFTGGLKNKNKGTIVLRNICKLVFLILLSVVVLNCNEKNEIDKTLPKSSEALKNKEIVDNLSENNDYHAVKEKLNEWNIEFVSKYHSTGKYNSIAVDGNNKIHISCYDSAVKSLIYITYRSGEWKNYTIDGKNKDEDIGMYNQIAVDKENNVHISYFDRTNKKLKYAKITGDTVKIDVVDKTDKDYIFNSLFVDDDGYANIAYYFYNGNDQERRIKYANNKLGNWHNIIVSDDMSSCRGVSISQDNNGYLHITYETSVEIHYITNKSGDWREDIILKWGDYSATQYFEGFQHSSKVDSKGFMHIIYTEGEFGLYHFTNEKGRWGKTLLYIVNSEYLTHNLYKTDFVLDKYDKLHISFLYKIDDEDETKYNPKKVGVGYATNKTGKWQVEQIEEIGLASNECSIAIDKEGYVHICYNDEPKKGKDFKYATNRPVSMAKIVDSTIVNDNIFLLAKK